MGKLKFELYWLQVQCTPTSSSVLCTGKRRRTLTFAVVLDIGNLYALAYWCKQFTYIEWISVANGVVWHFMANIIARCLLAYGLMPERFPEITLLQYNEGQRWQAADLVVSG